MIAALRELLCRPVVVRAAQVALGALFIVAALGKIGDPAAFAQQVHNYRLLPPALDNLPALTLPWVELLAGLAMLVGVRPRSGSVIVAALMVVFTVAVGLAMARGLDFECGCFGKAGASRIGAQKLIENALLTALAFVACALPRRGTR